MPNTNGICYDGVVRRTEFAIEIHCGCGTTYRSPHKVIRRDGLFFIATWKACPSCHNTLRGIRTERDPAGYDIRKQQ